MLGDNIFVFGESSLSYGLYSKPNSLCVLRGSKSKKPTQMSRNILVGDVITISLDLINSTLVVSLAGDEDDYKVSKKFGLPSEEKSPQNYIIGVSLAPGQGVSLGPKNSSKSSDVPILTSSQPDAASAAESPITEITIGAAVRIRDVSPAEAEVHYYLIILYHVKALLIL
jgi:hypothetical protein